MVLQKFGKSWLCLDLCICICTEQSFLGFNTNKCDCLYLALEDSYYRLKNRALKILKTGQTVPENFRLNILANSLNEGLLEQLQNEIEKYPNTKLIIIDTLQKIRETPSKSDSMYGNDYKEIGKLESFADEHKICILAIHHLRKSKDTDVFNQISGSTGLTGAADTMITLEKTKDDKSKVLLSITGRDVELTEKVLMFNPVFFKWEVVCDNIEDMVEQIIYDTNPIIITIKALLERNPTGLKITASELLKEIFETTGSYPKQDKPNTLSREITENLQFQLLEYDGIHYEPPNKNGGSAGRIMYFSKPNIQV